jgi:hypothetical protein
MQREYLKNSYDHQSSKLISVMIFYLEPANASEVEIFLLDTDLEALFKAHVVRPWRDELLFIVLARADIHVDVYVGC